jgi:hypothetical protein
MKNLNQQKDIGLRTLDSLGKMMERRRRWRMDVLIPPCPHLILNPPLYYQLGKQMQANFKKARKKHVSFTSLIHPKSN